MSHQPEASAPGTNSQSPPAGEKNPANDAAAAQQYQEDKAFERNEYKNERIIHRSSNFIIVDR